MTVARRQSLVQLSDELLSLLDERAARSGRSRSAVVREALELYLASDEQAALDAVIVDAYTRVPQPPDRWLEAVARDTIAAESW